MTTVVSPPKPAEVGPRRQGASGAPDRSALRARGRRRLIGAVAVLLILLVAAVAVALVALGSGEVPPATGAAEVVPAGVLAYVHLSTDPSRPAVARAAALARRFPDFPLLAGAVLTRVSAIVGDSSSVDFATEIRPWLGKEAALAVLSAPASATTTLIVLDVSEPARAHAFLTAAGARSAGVYAGVRLESYPSGTEVAFVRHYLVVGSDAGVRAAIEASAGRAPSLARAAAYQRAASREPPDRVLDAYLPASGVRQLLGTRGGALGALGVLLDEPGLTGTGISVSALRGGADVRIHSAFAARQRRPGSSFTPTLQSLLPAGATLMLDVEGLHGAAPRLLDAAAAAGIGANIAPLLGRLGAALAAEGVNVRSVLSLFDGETAVAIEGQAPGGASTPSLIIVSRVRHQAATQAQLAALEGPLTALFPLPSSGPGQVSELADRQAGGATVHELGLGPGLQLDYAVFNGLVVVSTSLNGVIGVAERSRSLAGETAYKSVLPARPQRLSSLLFLDFSQLLSLGEQTGLASGARLSALLGDLNRISVIGLDSTSGERATTTELRLQTR